MPHPGRIRELLVYISQQHSSLIDRAKPLWTCDIIEGIEGNRFAMYFKIHHAMVDGVAGMRLIEKSLSKHHKKNMWFHFGVESKRTKRLKVPKPSTSKIKSILGV